VLTMWEDREDYDRRLNGPFQRPTVENSNYDALPALLILFVMPLAPRSAF